MSELDLILGKPGITCPPDAKQQIKDLMLELIGEEREWDTTEPYDNPDMAQGYNEAITELRQKVEEL